jgi:SAM-dependent methyltransferase
VITAQLDACMSGWYQEESGELLTGFIVGAQDSVLEVGCGDGHAARFCAERGAEVLVNDLDPDVVSRLAALLGGSRARAVTALPGDASRLDLPAGRVNRVVAMEMLEHVEDPAAVVAELVRVGTPDCRYLFTVPDPLGESVHRVIGPPQYFEPPNHLRVFEREQFDTLLHGAGLVVERRVHYGFYGCLWWFLFWACRQGLHDPPHELLQQWERTWGTLLALPDGARIKAALDEVMPRSQALVARKQ